jgi:hypothetical protein
MSQLRQDHIVEIDRFGEPSSDQASPYESARVALENPSVYDDLKPVDADGPPIDEEETISEAMVRERLIEWLIGFLPGNAYEAEAIGQDLAFPADPIAH